MMMMVMMVLIQIPQYHCFEYTHLHLAIAIDFVEYVNVVSFRTNNLFYSKQTTKRI